MRRGSELWPDPPVHHRAPDNHGTRRMKIDGHCHCGQITFEAEVDPTALTICHCTDCQTLTGSAFRINIPAPAEHFVLRSGTPKSYVKTAESGNKRRHAFCGECGTPIYACAVDNPQSYALRVGTITQRAASSPRRHGGALRCIGWMRSPLCLRPRKGGQAESGRLTQPSPAREVLAPTTPSKLARTKDRFRRGPASAAPIRPAC